MGQGGFAHTGHVFYQQMSPGQQAGHGIVHLRLLADQHRVKLVQEPLHGVIWAGLWGCWCLHGLQPYRNFPHDRDHA